MGLRGLRPADPSACQARKRFLLTDRPRPLFWMLRYQALKAVAFLQINLSHINTKEMCEFCFLWFLPSVIRSKSMLYVCSVGGACSVIFAVKLIRKPPPYWSHHWLAHMMRKSLWLWYGALHIFVGCWDFHFSLFRILFLIIFLWFLYLDFYLWVWIFLSFSGACNQCIALLGFSTFLFLHHLHKSQRHQKWWKRLYSCKKENLFAHRKNLGLEMRRK